MARQEMLGAWVAIERGNGSARVLRTGRYLSFAAFAVTVATVLVSMNFELPRLVFFAPGVLVGWLIAERNALADRLSKWPILRQYIDWSHVDADLQGAMDK